MTTQVETARQQEAFAYLDDVRESGLTNMMAGPRLLHETFGLDRDEARAYFQAWTQSFEDGDR